MGRLARDREDAAANHMTVREYRHLSRLYRRERRQRSQWYRPLCWFGVHYAYLSTSDFMHTCKRCGKTWGPDTEFQELWENAAEGGAAQGSTE